MTDVEPMDRLEWGKLPLWLRVVGHVYWTIRTGKMTWKATAPSKGE